MKKNRLVQIIKEIAQEKGYSRFVPGGKTNGLTQKTLEQILLNIARQGEDEETYKGDPDRGNKILDKADPENVARILRGEEPKYNEVDRMQELAGIQSEIKVNDPLVQQEFEEFIKEWDIANQDPDDIEYAQDEVLEKYKGKSKQLDQRIEDLLKQEREYYQNL